MKKRKRGWIMCILFLVCLSLQSMTNANATQVQQVETEGSIGFTGIYKPIGTPDPTPPESIVKPPITEIAKPGGRLPQTNDSGNSWLTLLGTAIITFIFIVWIRKKKQHTKLK